LILRKSKSLKQNIIRKTTKELLRVNNHYKWTIINYLYKPSNALKKEGWNELVDKFKGLFVHLQELILKNYMEAPKYGVYNIVRC
jgi:hypothetical protein